MADWTNTRLNLRYHWKVVLLWGFIIGGILACGLISRADAWTRARTQLFPAGEAPVMVHRFCLGRGCEARETYSQAIWQREIRSAMAKWNAAGAAFTFTERATRSTDNPCNINGAVVIISYESGVGCSQDQRVFDDAKSRGIEWHGLTIYWPNTPRIYVKRLPTVENLRWNLLHELGHVVGLGHPDGAGQNVAAVMNLLSSYDELQPDDIAGIRALYGTRMVEEEPDTPPASVGYLGSPAPNAVVSGIGFVSGWKCDAQDITVRIDGGPALDMSMGVLRTDTSPYCDGEAHNGFITQVNWNHLSAGTHTAVAYDNGIEFGRSTFTVGTTGEEFLRGVVVDIDVPDFPTPGRTSRFVWNQSTQHLELAEVYEQQPPSPESRGDLSQFAFLIDDGAGDWEIDITTAAGESVLDFEDVSFLGYRTTATGREIMVGHFGSPYGPQTIDFELGAPADVLPRLSSFHAYRYALVLPITDAAVDIQTWQQFYGSRASSFCLALLFTTVTKDRYGDINMQVTGVISAREGGVCVPENGAESLVQPTPLRLEVYLD